MGKSLVIEYFMSPSTTTHNTSTTSPSEDVKKICVIISIVLTVCASIIYSLLLLSQKVRSMYPLNYILIVIIAIFTTVATACSYLQHDTTSALISVGLTAFIAFIVTVIGFNLTRPNRKGILVFGSLECIFVLSGVVLHFIALAVPGNSTQVLNSGRYADGKVKDYLGATACFCWILTVVIVLLITAIYFKYHIKFSYSKFQLTFDALTIWMGVLSLYVIISITYSYVKTLAFMNHTVLEYLIDRSVIGIKITLTQNQYVIYADFITNKL
ncbi:unnamed protein product [Heterobilharzia americana]|nr:unnamed protein product [Heterobilharzia americana]